MRKTFVAVAAIAALAVPAVSSAHQPKPDKQNKQNAAKFCRALRESAGKDNFRSMFGTNKNGKNAFGKCVSKNAKKDARQDVTAHKNAAKDCKAERAQDPAAFQDKYGTGKNKKNAYGKCVSQHAKQDKAEMDQQETENATNAAQTCRAEKKQDADAFRQKYGTNKNKKNAFGKCVSQHVKQEQQDQQ